MDWAAHILQGLSGRISLALDASWAACTQTPPCTIASCGTHQGTTSKLIVFIIEIQIVNKVLYR